MMRTRVRMSSVAAAGTRAVRLRRASPEVCADGTGLKMNGFLKINAHLLPVLLGAAFLAGPHLAVAQAAPAPQQRHEDQARLDEIIVTATRRPQNLHDVPVSVSSFDAAQIDALRPAGLEDLADFVPNMWMPPSTEAGQSFITMRGIGAGIARSSGRSVGVYIDGVFVNADTAMDVAMADIAGVEVLKGPQGTLFGRDTIGGAINITTRAPTGGNTGEARLSVGSFGLVEERTSADLGLREDVLALRIFALKRDRGGYIRNAFTGRKAGAQNHASASAVLSYTPAGRLDARLNLSWQHRHDRPNTLGEAVTNTGSDTIPYTINLDQDEFQTQSVARASVQANYDLGHGYTLHSISGWSHVRDFYIQDGDRLPIPITTARYDGRAQEWSQEVRLTSPENDQYDFVAGLYALRSSTLFSPTFPLMGAAFLEKVLGIPAAFQPADVLDGQRINGRTTSLAGYAHGNLYFNDKLSLFGGLRHTRERKGLDYRSFGEVFTVFGLPPLQHRARVSSHPLSWTAGARYRPSRALMGYASISRGYRSASIKDNFVSAADIAAGSGFFTKPEFVTNYESGLKLRTPNGRLRLNTAVFYMDYTDIQVAIARPPFLFLKSLENAARAHISGFEADVQAQATNRLRLALTAGYAHSRFDRFSPGPGLDLAGLSFGTAPVWTYSAAADYTLARDHGGAFQAHLDYAGRTAPSRLPPGVLAFAGNYGIANGWLGFESVRQGWKARLWVRNILDVNLPAASKLWGAGLGPLIENRTIRYEPPRMAGIEVSVRFGL